jgi:hypothetical protein
MLGLLDGSVSLSLGFNSLLARGHGIRMRRDRVASGGHDEVSRMFGVGVIRGIRERRVQNGRAEPDVGLIWKIATWTVTSEGL